MFNNIPNDVLLLEVLPNLRLPYLINACSVDKRINSLCNNEEIWKKRLINEYPDLTKPNDTSWKNFYLATVSKYRIPIILNGDIIDWAFISPRTIKTIGDDINNNLVIAYVDKRIKPVYIYYNGLVKPFYQDWTQINKIILITDLDANLIQTLMTNDFSNTEQYYSNVTKYFLSSSVYRSTLSQDKHPLVLLGYSIYRSWISPLSKNPIYGFILEQGNLFLINLGNNETQAKRCSILKHSLDILWTLQLTPQKISITKEQLANKLLKYYSDQELINKIEMTWNYYVNLDKEQLTDQEIINRIANILNEDTFNKLQLTTLTPEKLYFYYQWIITPLNICLEIKQYLKSIYHLVPS